MALIEVGVGLYGERYLVNKYQFQVYILGSENICPNRIRVSI